MIGLHLSARIKRAAKVAVATLATVGMTASMAACGNAQSEKKLYFWNAILGNQGNVMRQIVEDYNATDPEYKIVFQPMAGSDLLTKIYSVEQTGDNIPDVVLADNLSMAVMESQNILNTMDDAIEDEPSLGGENYIDAAWKSLQVDGRQYGIPIGFYGTVVFYNKALVEQYGFEHFLDDDTLTVDEVLSMKGKLPDDTYGIAIGDINEASTSLMFNAGGDLDRDVHDMTSQPWRDAFGGLQKITKAGLAAPYDSDVTQVFGSGKAVFMALFSGDAVNMGDVMGGDDKFGMINALQLNADNLANYFGMSCWLQLKDPKRSEERTAGFAKFVAWFQDHWLERWAKIGYITPLKSVMEDPEYQEYKSSFFVKNQRELDSIRYSSNVYANYKAADWAGMKDLAYNKMSLDEGLAKINQAVQGQIQIQKETEE